MNLRKIKTVSEFVDLSNILYRRFNNLNKKIFYKETSIIIYGNYKTIKCKRHNEYTLRSKVEDQLGLLEYAATEIIDPKRNMVYGESILCKMKDKHIERIMGLFLELNKKTK